MMMMMITIVEIDLLLVVGGPWSAAVGGWLVGRRHEQTGIV